MGVSRRRVPLAALLIVLLAGLALWWRGRPDGLLHIIMPALEGDAIVAITPAGRTIVVDGGGDPSALPRLLGERLPPWRRSLDLLVLTHADSDRLPGLLAVARRYQVRMALLPAEPSSADERALYELLRERGASVVLARAGDGVALDGVSLRVLQAGEGRLALRLSYGSFAALLAPQPRPGQLEALAAEPADLLFYPWSGPDDRTLASRLGSKVLVYGEGRLPEREQGAPRTFYARGGGERPLLHEELHGAVELTTDGPHSWLEVERPPREAPGGRR